MTMPTPRATDMRKRLSQTPRMSISSVARTPTTDIRKRMDDVYAEMQQNASAGQLRLPLKFASFHESDAMFQFTRAVVGYALAYVRVKTLERDHAEFVTSEELAKFHAAQQQQQQHSQETATSSTNNISYSQSERDGWQQRLELAVELQKNCTTLLGETYARLVLHCSNFEHHKEDERFFECVFFFVCAVAKVGLAPEFWDAIEHELGYLFRGAQFSATIKHHSAAKTQRQQASAAAAAAAAASDAANTAAKKIQSLSPGAGGGASGKDARDALRGRDAPPFELPSHSVSRCCYFSASLPVGKIVSELDAAKLRATRNMEISQSVREELQQRRRTERSPRPSDAAASSLLPVQPPTTPRSRTMANGSPRLSMKATFTSRSPAVNHLLPGTEDRVRLVLETYEKELQAKLRERPSPSPPSPSQTEALSSSASTVSTVSTATASTSKSNTTTAIRPNRLYI